MRQKRLLGCWWRFVKHGHYNGETLGLDWVVMFGLVWRSSFVVWNSVWRNSQAFRENETWDELNVSRCVIKSLILVELSSFRMMYHRNVGEDSCGISTTFDSTSGSWRNPSIGSSYDGVPALISGTVTHSYPTETADNGHFWPIESLFEAIVRAVSKKQSSSSLYEPKNFSEYPNYDLDTSSLNTSIVRKQSFGFPNS